MTSDPDSLLFLTVTNENRPTHFCRTAQAWKLLRFRRLKKRKEVERDGVIRRSQQKDHSYQPDYGA